MPRSIEEIQRDLEQTDQNLNSIASQYRVRCCRFSFRYWGLNFKKIRGGCPLISQS